MFQQGVENNKESPETLSFCSFSSSASSLEDGEKGDAQEAALKSLKSSVLISNIFSSSLSELTTKIQNPFFDKLSMLVAKLALNVKTFQAFSVTIRWL